MYHFVNDIWPLVGEYSHYIVKQIQSLLASMQFGELKCHTTLSHLFFLCHPPPLSLFLSLSLCVSLSLCLPVSACQWRQSGHFSHQAINVL